MTLSYVVREPTEPTPRPPLLVLLHGIGADERDLLPLAGTLHPRFLVASIRAPYDAMPMGHAWYAIDWSKSPPASDLAQAEESRDALCALLPALAERHGADPELVFVLGFSQGAAMALAVALTRPELLRGAVLHSGRILPGLAASMAPPEALARLEVIVLHGVGDEVLPIRCGREIRDLLAPLLGDRLTYREHDAGHFVTQASLDDAAAWLATRVG